MKKLPSLSIFLPAFNEEKNIGLVINQVLKFVPKISQKFEILIIDDGSIDHTADEVKKISQLHSQVKLIQHPHNQGYGAALKSGFYNSRYAYITYMDGDRQFDFTDLNKLIEKIDQADLVIGYRIKRADNWVRVLNGKLWNFLVSLLLRLRVKDIDCGFKLVKKEVIDAIPKLESNGATISGELLIKAHKKGFKIEQVGLKHKPRKFGSATGGNPLHIFRAFYDLFSILPKV